VLRIWPAIVYQATGELCRSIMEHLDTEYSGRARETNQYRRTFLLATLIACLSLMISGIFFSSAWVVVTTTTQTVAIVFYGFFAGKHNSFIPSICKIILEFKVLAPVCICGKHMSYWRQCVRVRTNTFGRPSIYAARPSVSYSCPLCSPVCGHFTARPSQLC